MLECHWSLVTGHWSLVTGRHIAFRAANPSYSGDYLYIDKFDGLATGGMPSGWSRPRMYDSRPRI